MFLELFSIAHPHVELRYLLINKKEVKLIKQLTALKWSISLKGCSEVYILKLGFTPCKAEQPLESMELQEKETQKDQGIHEICLERTYS